MLRSAFPTLSAFFADSYRPHRLTGASPATIGQYGVTLNHFRRFLCREPQLHDLDSDRIVEFLTWLSPGRSPGSVWNARKHLLALATFAHRKGAITEVPEVARVRQLRRAPTSYTIENIARLLTAARGTAGLIGQVPAPLFFSAIFLVFFDTGARAGAVWALRWDDWHYPALLFRAEHAKERADQILRVSDQTADALERIRRPTRDIIFLWPFCRRLKYNRIRSIFIAAGLPHGRRDLLQRLRRTTATLMHRAGGNASLQLGHADPSMAARHYLDLSGELQACDLLPRPTLPSADRQRRLF